MNDEKECEKLAKDVVEKWEKEWVIDNKHDKKCVRWYEGYYPPFEPLIAKVILSHGKSCRKDAIASCVRNYNRLLRSLMGNEVADKFSEKMAKGWDNLMKFMENDS